MLVWFEICMLFLLIWFEFWYCFWYFDVSLRCADLGLIITHFCVVCIMDGVLGVNAVRNVCKCNAGLEVDLGVCVMQNSYNGQVLPHC